MLDVQLISTEEIVFEGRANSIVFPGENGVFEILPYHKPLVSRLIAGNVVIDGRLYPIRRGLVGVNRNKATIIVEK
jgi:F-type H+-transporting ATPase subunit epsilon